MDDDDADDVIKNEAACAACAAAQERAFECVVALCKKYGIDESHGLSHSLDVLRFAQQILASESDHPERRLRKKSETIVAVAAIVHDMCDKKYVAEAEGVRDIADFLRPVLDEDSLDAVVRIISTMSYSAVRRDGFPPDADLLYHVVREADLLAAYDIHRCIVFEMMKRGVSYLAAKARAKALYETRVMTYLSDGLFVTHFGHLKATELAAMPR